MRKIWLLAALALVALAAPSATAQVTDPGLENWSAGQLVDWTDTASSTHVQDSTNQHGGSYCAVVTPTATYRGLEQLGIPVTGGTRYRLSVGLRGGGTGEDDSVRLLVNDGVNAPYILGVNNFTDSAWTRYDFDFTVAAGATAVDLQLGAFQNPAVNPITFLVDDVSIVAVPATSGTPLNGDFETWSGQWLSAANWFHSIGTQLASYERTLTARSGSYAAEVTPKFTYGGIQQSNIPISPSTDYRLSFALRGGGTGEDDTVRLVTDDGSGAVVTNFNTFVDASWTRYSYEFTSDAGASAFSVKFDAGQNPSVNPIVFLVDDVSLDEVPTVSGTPLNGDFETWSGLWAQAEAWIDTNEASDYEQTTTAREGTFAALVKPTATYGGVRQQNIPVTGGTTYRLSAWLRGAGTGGDDAVRILAYDGVGFFTMGTGGGGLPDSQWKRFSLEFTPDAGATSVEIQFGAFQNPAVNPIEFYIDGVSLDEVTPLSGSPLNGDFEIWSGIPPQADGWGQTNEAAGHAQSTTARGGSYAAEVTPTATYGGIRQLNVPVTGGSSYRLSCALRGGGTGEDDSVRLLVYDGTSFFTRGASGFTDSAWRRYELDFTVDAGATSVEIQFGAFQDPGVNPITFLIDDVSLAEIPATSGTPLNGDFETWFGAWPSAAGWSIYNNASYERTTTARAGSYAAEVTPYATYHGISQAGIPVTGGATYRLSLGLRGGGTGEDDSVRLLVNDGISPAFTAGAGGFTDSEWTRYTLEFTVDAGATAIELQLGAFQDPAANPITFLVDDVSIDEVTPLSGTPLNGDFEVWSGLWLQADAWVDTGEASSYVQTGTAHGGSFAAEVTPTQTYGGIRQANVPVTPGERYRLSAWIRGGGTGGDDTVRMMVYDGASFFTQGTGILSDAAWQPYYLEFTAAPGVTSVEIQFGAFQDPGSNAITFLIDDVVLNQRPALTGTPLNGDLEQWWGTPAQAEAWVDVGGSSYIQTTTAHEGGTYAAEVTPTATYDGIKQAGIPVQPETDYRLVAWMRGGGTGGDDAVRLLVFDGANSYVGSTGDQGGLSDTQWRMFTLDFTTTVGVTSIEVQFGAFQDPGANPITFLIDNIALFERVALAGNPPNGDFEVWNGVWPQADEWINTGEVSTYSRITSATTVHSGNYAASVTPAQTYGGIRQLNVPVNPGSRYELSAWMRGGGTGDDDSVRMLVYDGTNSFTDGTGSQGGLVDAEWRRFSLDFTAGTSVTSVQIQFGAFQDPGANPITFYIDDVAVTELTPLTGTPLNGDFEAWRGAPLQAEAWVEQGTSSHAQTTTAHTGSFAAEVTPTTTYGGLSQANVPVTPQGRYVLTAWLRGGGTGGDDTVRLMAWDGTTGYIAGSGVLSDSEWRPASVEFFVPFDVTSIQVQIGAFQDPGANPITFLVDDVVLTELDPITGSPLNGDFESWPYGSPLRADRWVDTGEASSYVQTTTAHGGSFAAAVTPTQTYGGIRQLGVAVRPDHQYRLTAWLRGGGTGGDDTVRIMAFYGSNFFTTSTGEQGGLSDDEWRQFTLDLSVGADVNYIEIQFGAYQDPNANPITFLIDDVVLMDMQYSPNAVQHWHLY